MSERANDEVRGNISIHVNHKSRPHTEGGGHYRWFKVGFLAIHCDTAADADRMADAFRRLALEMERREAEKRAEAA